MTSPSFNARKAAAEAEMSAYDSLTPALRAAVDAAPKSVRASVVLATFLRGVPERAIIETIERSQSK